MNDPNRNRIVVNLSFSNNSSSEYCIKLYVYNIVSSFIVRIFSNCTNRIHVIGGRASPHTLHNDFIDSDEAYDESKDTEVANIGFTNQLFK
jgi:hypothetical protein